jgi:hypothetical protein
VVETTSWRDSVVFLLGCEEVPVTVSCVALVGLGCELAGASVRRSGADSARSEVGRLVGWLVEVGVTRASETVRVVVGADCTDDTVS